MSNDGNKIWFSYLKHLDIPQKLPISHKIVELLVESDLELVEESESMGYEEILDHQKLTPAQQELENVLKKLSTQETAFKVAQTEYEKKEKRFLELTNLSQQMLDQRYADNDLLLRDIDRDLIARTIKTRAIHKIIATIKEAVVIIKRDVDVFYDRIKHLTYLWKEISADLLKRLNSFEFRGLKVVSNNLRVKLLPTIKELKSELKDAELVEDSISRVDIEIQINDMVDQAREDIYGDLTQSQINLLNDINPDLTPDELIRILTKDDIREDLIVLLKTEKIEIQMKKVIDRLI